MSATTFLTNAAAARAPQAAEKPVGGSPGDRYLLALLEAQRGLRAATKALVARAANADGDETRYIAIQEGMIDADYLKLSAMVTAYLSNGTVMTPISQEELDMVRALLERISGYTATLIKASQIVGDVAAILATFSAPAEPAEPAKPASDADLSEFI